MQEVFVIYSLVSKAYRVYNKQTKVIEESIHLIFDETNNGRASWPPFTEFQLSKDIVAEIDEL